jgi:16S rRNA processing protein RimM
MSVDQLSEELVLVARAVKTRGLKGEIVADLLTDFPERFADLSRLFCVTRDGARIEVTLEKFWPHQDRIVLKFVGFDDVDAAAKLVGCDFGIPESERVKLPEGQFYNWELEGCVVETIAGQQLGRVRDVMRSGEVETLIVQDADFREHLIPMAEPIVVKIDIEHKAISIDPPPGLLDL